MEIKSVRDFNKFIKSKDARGPILIFGEEKNWVKESIKLVYDIINSFPEINIIEIDGETVTYDEIINSCETLPFMSDKKLVYIKNPYFLLKTNNSPTAEISELLTKYITRIPEEVILLIGVIGETDTRNKVVTAIKNSGTLVEYKKIKGDELHKWVMDEFDKYGKTISKADLIYMISEIGSSTESLETEIDKLCSYAIEEEVINKRHIDNIVYKSLESNIFKMVDSISRRDAEKALTILKNLLFQREDHLRILGMIIRQYRMLYLVKQNMEQNKPNSEIEKSLKLTGFTLQNFMKQARVYGSRELMKSLNKCLDTDFNIKMGKYQPEMALELLIVELCKWKYQEHPDILLGVFDIHQENKNTPMGCLIT